MSVPILDDEYMARRRQERYFEAMSQSYRHSFGRGFGLGPPRESAETLREEYATGLLTFEQFERRVERLLGCT